MVQEYRLKTPEAVNISYAIAGIGTRFLASFVDGLIWIALQIVIVVGSLAMQLQGGSWGTAGTIAGLTMSFLLFWAYFAAFETVWNGQTPGKRMLKLRVISVAGYPMSSTQAVVRNLVRIVDFLPVFYGVGVIVMFISTQSRRLGDFAAGTIVVRESGQIRIAELDSTPLTQGRTISQPRLGEVDPDELAWDLRALGQDDVNLVFEFLQRAPTLQEPARQRLGDRLAERVARQIGAREALDSVRFLERVLHLRQV